MAKELYTALTSEGAEIEMDLEEHFFSALYSSFRDPYGIHWMIPFEGN